MKLLFYTLCVCAVFFAGALNAKTERSKVYEYRKMYNNYKKRYEVFTKNAHNVDAEKKASYERNEAARNKSWASLQKTSERNKEQLLGIEDSSKYKEQQRRLMGGCQKNNGNCCN